MQSMNKMDPPTNRPTEHSYRSAAGALAGRPVGHGPRPPRRETRSAVDGHHATPRPVVPRAAPRCAGSAVQRPQRRHALRENTPPWSVRLERRFAGKLINVSRRGLAIEVREAPPFYPKGRLQVDVRGQPLELEVAVQWCRLVGLEEIDTGHGVETAPRYQLGLGCEDPALERLGAPPACKHARRSDQDC